MAKIVANFSRHGVVTGRNTIADEEQRSKVGIDAIELSIRAVAGESVHVLNAFQVDTIRADVTKLHHPIRGYLALSIQEPTLAVMHK